MKTIAKPISQIAKRVKKQSSDLYKNLVGPDDKVVAVRDYVAGKGYSGAVDWDGENPTVGGVKIKPRYIENGIAYVSRDDADNAIAKLEENAGIIGMDGAEKARAERFGEAEDDAVKKVAERDEFSYSLEDDPVYSAYKDIYERGAEDAYRRVLNDNNSSVTTASNVVLSEAMAAQNNELRKLAEMVPELYENAYERYIDSAELDRQSLEAIEKVADSYYDRLYNQNLDATENLRKAGEAERKEKQRWVDNEREDYQFEQKNNRENERAFYENALDSIEIEKGNIELDTYDEKVRNDIYGDMAVNEGRVMDNAIARGFFIESDEAMLPWLSEYKNPDGTYSISPAMASLSYEYQTYHTRERAKINAKLGR